VESSDFCLFLDNLRLPPGLAFAQPNLPFLMQEIIGRLLAARENSSPRRLWAALSKDSDPQGLRL
jgi:hypothetical protein